MSQVQVGPRSMVWYSTLILSLVWLAVVILLVTTALLTMMMMMMMSRFIKRCHSLYTKSGSMFVWPDLLWNDKAKTQHRSLIQYDKNYNMIKSLVLPWFNFHDFMHFVQQSTCTCTLSTGYANYSSIPTTYHYTGSDPITEKHRLAPSTQAVWRKEVLYPLHWLTYTLITFMNSDSRLQNWNSTNL